MKGKFSFWVQYLCCYFPNGICTAYKNCPKFLGFFVLIFIVFISKSSLFSCDDAFLNLITGKKPSEEFTKNLLRMNQLMREMATDLAALNKVSAERKLKIFLKIWLDFDSNFRQKPPHQFQSDPQWSPKLKTIADMLGELRKLMEGEKFQEAHDLLEPLSCYVSYLGVTQEKQRMARFLDQEILFYSIKPFPGANESEVMTKTASFATALDEMSKIFPTACAEKFRAFRSQLDEFKSFLEKPTEHKSAVALSIFKKLTEKFMDLKKDLLANNWFE